MTALGAAARRPTQLPLFGRGTELASARDYLEEMDGSVTRTMVFRGEAGIGKSRLLVDLTGTLPGAGWTVLETRVDEIGRVVPYGEFRRAVANFADAHEGSLQAELATRLVDALDVAADQPLAAIHAAALRFVASVTDTHPLAVVIDDLELADDDTLVVLANLLRQQGRCPLVVLASLRRPEPTDHAMLTAFLSRARDDGLLYEVELGPLDNAAIGELTAAVLGERPNDDIVDTVRRESGGNPFFAVQSVLNAVESRCTTDMPPIMHPSDRRRAFLDRMLRVGSDVRRLARAVALLGAVSVARLPLAAELAELSAVHAGSAFDTLVRRGVVEVDDDGGFRVCHQLVRAALVEEIGPAERAVWHRLAAARLAALPTSTALDLEIAGHVQHVAEPGDEYAIAVLSRAAEIASVAAPRSAIPWFERALSVTPDAHPEHAKINARLARALLLAGQPLRAIDVGRQALAGLGGGEAHSHLAALLIDSLVLTGAMDEAATLADAELGRGDANLRLAATSARAHMVANRLSDALRDIGVVQRRLESASVTEQLHALAYVALTRTLQPSFDELTALWQRMATLAKHAPPTAQLAAYTVMSYTQTTMGETAAATQSIAYAQRLFARVGWTLYRVDLAVAQAYNAAHLGEWSSALAVIDSIEDELGASGSFMHRDTLRALKIDMLANRGEWTAARKAADTPLSDNRHGAAVQTWAHAGLELLVGELPAARERLEQRLSRGDVPAWLAARLISRLAEVEIEADRLRHAAELVADLASRRADVVGHPTWVAVHLAHGHATGDLDALRSACAVADKHRLALLSGRARLVLGQHDIDTEANLTQAARIFQRLGAAPWRRRAVAEIRRRGLKIPRERTHATTTLTEIETQIVRLVQLGHSNRDIAATVFLSVKTVENHLSRIYRKTGLPNRLNLIRALDAGSLVL